MRFFAVLIILFLVFGIGAYQVSHAASSISVFFGGLLAYIFYGIAWVLGWLTMLVFSAVITISGFQDFVNNPGVIEGWTIIRDICNMLFVIILLIIAFATILRIEKYSIKSLLPKVIFAAVVINFSKLICGLIIDLSQVVMLTFVNGFQASAGANLINGLKLDTWMSAKPKKTQEQVDFWDIALALALACVLFFFTLIVTIILAVILGMRIVFLWILIVLSPFAFVGMLLPFTQSLARQWWQKFGTWVAIGPILAFFLWLALFMMQGNISADLDELGSAAQEKSQITDGPLQEGNMSEGSSMPNIVQFMVGVALLYGAVTMTKKMGGSVGAAVGGRVMGAAKGAAYKYTGARAVGERYKAARGALAARREERYKEFGARARRGYERTVGVAAEAGKSAVKGVSGAPFRAAGLAGRRLARIGGLDQKASQFKGNIKSVFARDVPNIMRELGKTKVGRVGSVISGVLGLPQAASAVRTARSKALGTSYETARNEVGSTLKSIKDKKYSGDESADILQRTADRPGLRGEALKETVAHAINAVQKDAIKTPEQEQSLKALQQKVEGTPMKDVLENETNKRFAYAFRDLNKFDERQDLRKLHERGETDLTNQNARFYSDPKAVQTLFEHFGDDADKAFKKIHERGGEFAKNLDQGLQAASGSENMAQVSAEISKLIEKGEENWSEAESQKYEQLTKFTEDFNSQLARAKVTGKPVEVLTGPGEMKNYVQKAKVIDLEKINLKKASDEQKIEVTANINPMQLHALANRGNRPDLIRETVIQKLNQSARTGDEAQSSKAELKQIVNNNVIMNALEPDQRSRAESIVASASPGPGATA